MNLLIISQYFWPENFRINDLALGLNKKGINVTILTAFPNYPNKEVYKSLKLDKRYNGMKVIRVPIISRGNNKLSLFLNYLSFIFSGIFLGSIQLYNKSFDIIFVFQPSPITSIIPAIFISKIKKAKMIIWVLDLWPDTLKPMGLLNYTYLNKMAFFLSNFIYKKADLIFGQSKSMSVLLKKRLPHKNIKFLPNWVEEELFLKTKIKTHNETKTFKIFFAGNIGLAQDFDSIIKSIELIPRSENIQVIIIGDGKEKSRLVNQVRQKKLTNIILFQKAVPLENISALLHQADALILALKKAEIFEYTIPGKMQSYLAIGLPIISMLSGESAGIIENNKLGLNAISGDYKKLATNILKLKHMSKFDRNTMGKNCKKFAKENYKRESIINNLIKELNLLV
jgi:colanic acid biosynthesis glycosyl transferase WcaI